MVTGMYGYILNKWCIPLKVFACSLTEKRYYWHPAAGSDSEVEIFLVTGRAVRYTFLEQTYTLPEGTALCCSCRKDSPRGECTPEQPVHIDTLCISWDPEAIEHREFTEADYANPNVLLLPCFLSPCPELSRIERLIKQYIHHSVSDTAAGRAMCISLWYELTAVMDRTARRLHVPNQNHTAEYYARKLDAIIEKQYGTRLQLADLAEELGVSANYLSAVYCKERGQRFCDSLLARRMECARQLLLQGGLSLQYIAEAVGFSGEPYLRRQFRRYYGITPTEFLRIERELTLYIDRPVQENTHPQNLHPKKTRDTE